MLYVRTLAAAVAASIAIPASAQVYIGAAEVIDGDTLDLGGTRFRLFGIDAVEARQTCDGAGEQWSCGMEATIVLKGLVKGESVSCAPRDIDRYGRVVAKCLANGWDLAEQMARMGYAVALTDFSADYVAPQEAAENARRGIWGGEFQMPSDFRKSDPATAADNQALLAEQHRRDREASASDKYEAPASPSGTGVYYRNCAEARAAGVTPIYRGQPGYGAHMDGDGDGIACEPYRGR